jgi:hypothetical protein
VNKKVEGQRHGQVREKGENKIIEVQEGGKRVCDGEK